jgi:hypothetical protein
VSETAQRSSDLERLADDAARAADHAEDYARDAQSAAEEARLLSKGGLTTAAHDRFERLMETVEDVARGVRSWGDVAALVADYRRHPA